MSKAKLIYSIGILQKKDLTCTSEVGWISKSNLLITIDNKYFYINLDQIDLISVKNGIMFGYQQVNLALFVSFVTVVSKKEPRISKKNKPEFDMSAANKKA